MKGIVRGLVLALFALFAACSSSAVVGTINGERAGTGGIFGTQDGAGGTDGEGVGAKATGGADRGAGGLGAGGTVVGGDSGGSVGTGGAPQVIAGPDVTVWSDEVRQLIRGFGINNNWAPILPQAETLFGNEEGQLGLNILRIGMGSDGGPYNGVSAWNDIQAADALAEGGVIVIGTVWSPPPDCKSNGSIVDGGHLLESCYEQWSDTIAAFPAKVREGSGVDLYAMSPQTEMDFASCGNQEPCDGNYDSTVMTGAEAAAFQKIVGPKLRNAGVTPMSAETSQWNRLWSNESASGSEPSGLPSSDPLQCGFPANNPACLNDFGGYDYGHALAADPQAWSAFDIVGTHQYVSQVAEMWPADVEKGNKEVWQTEMCGRRWWPEQGPSGHIENGVAVARWIHSGLTVGEANAWLWWWWESLSTDDNEGLVLRGGETTKRFSTFGNFTKYVRPGYHRVHMTGEFPDKVLMSAYRGDDGTVVVVAINETNAAQEIPITISGGAAAPTEMTPYRTSATEDIAAQSAVPVVGGIFQAALPAMSVTTYVGQ